MDKLIERLYRLFLTFNSTYLIVVVFLVKERYYLVLLEELNCIYVSWCLFILFPVVLTYISFCVARKLPKDAVSAEEVVEIELANNNFLPTYLGYFFVSLSINDIPTLIVVYGIIFVFTYLSQTLYFNPIFLLFKYHFYFLKTSQNKKIFLITKKEIKKPREAGFNRLRRINNYTFINI